MFVYLFICYTARHVGSWFPNQGSNPCPMHWEHGVLTTGPPGKSLCVVFFFFFLLNLFIIYLFLAVLGLCFCARAFSSCGKWGPLFITVRGPLTIAVSLVVEHRLQTRRLSSCGSRAWLLRGMWDLPRPGLEPVYPALAGRFSTTAPPGKLCVSSFDAQNFLIFMKSTFSFFLLLSVPLESHLRNHCQIQCHEAFFFF